MGKLGPAGRPGESREHPRGAITAGPFAAGPFTRAFEFSNDARLAGLGGRLNARCRRAGRLRGRDSIREPGEIGEEVLSRIKDPASFAKLKQIILRPAW